MELYFYKLYYHLKNLSSFEYQITIADFKDYFSVYPKPFDIFLIISVIKGIENKVAEDKKEKEENKKKNKVQKVK